jgi:hypothetical protein
MEERRDVMYNVLTDEQVEALYAWLINQGYLDAEAWAADSDYQEDDEGNYYDEDGNLVDTEMQAWFAMEAEQSVD